MESYDGSIVPIMSNVPNASRYIMVCKSVDPEFEKYVVESKENKSHFGSNSEYVVVVDNPTVEH